MNKTHWFLLGFLCLSYVSKAQSFNRDEVQTKKSNRMAKHGCQPYYIGVSGGINNPSGLIGLRFDYTLTNHTTVSAHSGLGTWGLKSALMYNYFRQPCHRGWQYGAGFSLATGNRNSELKLETIAGERNVRLNLLPQVGLQFNIMRTLLLGKKEHRVTLGGGWNQRVSRKIYTVKDGNQLSLNSDRLLNTICPGGLTLSATYSIGFGGNKK
ncbi:MAG: hypothetical protein FGM54_04505 [Chitinophagaceae bacterium]|nr:hypothetical protein [Chitinophagaceae bacterium]